MTDDQRDTDPFASTRDRETDPDGPLEQRGGDVGDEDAPRGAMSVDDLAALFRSHQQSAPPAVTARAVQRVRLESTALALLRTLGGAWIRVARALPDLIGRPDAVADDLEDTGELPRAG